MRERALAEAGRADRTRATARSSLLGVPYGAKDLVAATGAPTTWGAPPYRDQRFDEDATVITKLRRAGAVLAAKLAMVGWILERLGRRRRRRPRAVGHRLRDIGLHRDARGVLRRDRPPADVRARQPSRRDGPLVDARQAWPDGPDRR